ncbi:hypothetical protein CPC08DRAFT_74071 [Agrocybe pediades]|nr:hypothetical protein CPC08DRAFT_74071 [Agrocybe pediades]
MAHSDISDDESEYQSNDNAGNDPDCRKGVPYIIIPWSHHPKYDRRLLEWLKENEIARRALFRKGTHVSNREKERLGGGNKSEFSYQAGIYVLSQDEDPLIRKKIKELEKRQIVKAVGGHILQWRREYKAVNEKLGRKVSNLTYDEIVASVDKDEIRVIDEKIGRFSLWKELHVFFRTNPWANQYHPADVRATKTQSASASPSNTVTEPYVVVNTRT